MQELLDFVPYIMDKSRDQPEAAGGLLTQLVKELSDSESQDQIQWFHLAWTVNVAQNLSVSAVIMLYPKYSNVYPHRCKFSYQLQ